MDKVSGAPLRGTGSREPSPAVSALSGFDPARDELDAWLTEHCGRGLPHFDTVETLDQALHGLAYVLHRINSTDTYRPFIGQGTSAQAALQWTLDHFAREALRGVPADVARLVVAARVVAFGGASPASIRELDAASEAFADRVCWDDEPEAAAKARGDAS